MGHFKPTMNLSELSVVPWDCLNEKVRVFVRQLIIIDFLFLYWVVERGERIVRVKDE